MIRMLLLVAAILMLVVGCEKPPVDASVSVLIVVGAGIIFLVTLGIRIRRVRALKAIHELRVAQLCGSSHLPATHVCMRARWNVALKPNYWTSSEAQRRAHVCLASNNQDCD